MDNSLKFKDGISLKPLPGQPANGTNGDIYYDSAMGSFQGFANGAWETLGSGTSTAGADANIPTGNIIGMNSSFVLVNTNDVNADTSVGNWAAYAGAPGVSPVDMTGGSPTVTITRTTTGGQVLNGAGSFLITKDAANRQGEGVSVFTYVPLAYRGSTALIQLPFKVISGSLSQGDLKLFVYDDTNGAVITPFNNDVVGNSGILEATFQIPYTCGQFRFGFHFASTSTAAVTLSFDDVFVGVASSSIGPALSNWVSDPNWTIDNAGTLTNVDFRWRRVGDSMEVEFTYLSGTAVAGVYAINLPSIYSIDSTKISNYTNAQMVGILFRSSGSAGYFDTDHGAVLFYDGSTNNKIFASITDNSNVQFRKNFGTSIAGTGDHISGRFTIPIAGWDSNVVVAQSSTFNISSLIATGSRVTATPANLGEYRTYQKNGSATTGVDDAPSTGPSIANGMRIYSVPFGSAGTSGQTNRWEIFVGKNKTVRFQPYSSSGRTGSINTDLLSRNTAEQNGIHNGYDPTTGVYFVDTIEQNSSVSSNFVGEAQASGGGASSFPTDCYFDLIVSENALAVGVQMPGADVRSADAMNLIGMTDTFQPINSDDINAERSIGNWASYEDAADIMPVDMHGGSPTVAISRTTASGQVLNGTGSFKVIKDAANRQGEGVSVLTNVPVGYRGITALIQLPFKLISGSLAQGDLKTFIYDVTNASVITPFNNDVISNGILSALCAIPTNCEQLRFGFHFASTSATAVTFSFDDVFVGLSSSSIGPALGDWQEFTMNITGAGSDPTKGTTLVDQALWRRVGDSMEIQWTYIQTSGGSAGSGAYLFALPDGFSIDSAKVTVNTDSNIATQVGIGDFNNSSNKSLTTRITAYDSRHFIGVYSVSDAYNGLIGSGVPLSGADWRFSFKAIVPISGWSANLTVAQSSTFNISSFLQNGVNVTTQPARLGEYRSMYKASANSSTLTDTTPTILPNSIDGMKIHATSYPASGTAGAINRYEIYIGKNKTFKVLGYGSTGKTGFLDIVPWNIAIGGSNVYTGLKTAYDPTIGVLLIDASAEDTSIQASDRFVGGLLTEGTNGAMQHVNDGYFEVIVSENALAVGMAAPRSEVWISAGNGFGSTNTYIRRFVNIQKNLGTAISYFDDSSLGAYFKINETGVYVIDYYDGITAAENNENFALSHNATGSELTTNPEAGLPFPKKLAFNFNSHNSAASGPSSYLSATVNCDAGDILRAHATAGAINGVDNVTWIRITQISR